MVNILSRRWMSCFSRQRNFLANHAGGSVDLEKDDSSGIAIITLRHHGKKNALTGEMMVSLSDIATTLNRWDTGKAFIIRGSDETFCSGSDLQVMKGLINEPAGGAMMAEFMHHTMTSLFQSRLLSLALIEGHAVGGGSEIATACDFRLATSNGKIGFIHSRMGLIPGWGGASRLVRLVGRTQALKLLASAAVLDAQTAVDMKLVDEIVSSVDPLQDAREWLMQFVHAEASVVHAIKRTVSTALETDLNDSLKNEAAIFVSLFGGKAQRNAMQRNVKHR